MKHNPSETSAYTPGTPALPQPIPQEVIPTCKKIDRKCFYGTFFFLKCKEIYEWYFAQIREQMSGPDLYVFTLKFLALK